MFAGGAEQSIRGVARPGAVPIDGRCGERASRIARTRPVNWATDAGSLAGVSPGWSIKFRMAGWRLGCVANCQLTRCHQLAGAAAEVETAVRAVTSHRVDSTAPAGDRAE